MSNEDIELAALVAVLTTSLFEAVLRSHISEESMFGSKNAKEERLKLWVPLLRKHGEMTPGDIARALKVSSDAIEDDLVTLHSRGVLICQKGHKLSLLEHWSAGE